MRLLLDTCTFLWLSVDPKRIPQRTYETILSGETEVLLSPVVPWELAIKCAKHGESAIRIEGPVERFVSDSVAAYRLIGITITIDDTLRAAALPPHHRDPFDRMLIAQALAEDIAIATPDPAFAPYGVRLLWQ